MCFQKTLISASGNIIGLISTQKCQIPKTFHQHNTCQFFSGFLVLVIYKRNFRIWRRADQYIWFLTVLQIFLYLGTYHCSAYNDPVDFSICLQSLYLRYICSINHRNNNIIIIGGSHLTDSIHTVFKKKELCGNIILRHQQCNIISFTLCQPLCHNIGSVIMFFYKCPYSVSCSLTDSSLSWNSTWYRSLTYPKLPGDIFYCIYLLFFCFHKIPHFLRNHLIIFYKITKYSSTYK